MKQSKILRSNWLSQKVHISWHIAYLSLGIISGIALAPHWGGVFAGNEWLLIVISICPTICIKRTRYLLITSVIVGCIFGLWRGADRHDALAEYKPLYGTEVVLRGVVSEDTSYGPKGDQRVRISNVTIQNQTFAGTVWVSTQNHSDIKRGDTISLSGLLNEGFGNIPASMFRADVESVERPYPGDIGRRTRDWFANGVNEAMPPDDANFALAFLVGQKLTLTEGFADKLKVVGLIHAVVASGYHLTVLIGLVRRLFVKVSKYLTTLFAAGMIGGFIMITGFSPSMTRAGLVSGLSLAAWYYGRVIHPLVLLPFAAALTAIYQPEYVWGDVGWYLSFAAFAGVIILAPLLNHYFWGRDKKPSLLREVLIATFAAQLATLPITMHVFGYYSMYALLANALVVPLIPLTMLLTFISGLLGLLITPIAPWFGHLVSWLLDYMKMIVNWIIQLPSSQTEITFSVGAVIIGYVLIGLLTVFLWVKTKHNFRDNSKVNQTTLTY